VVDLDTQAAWDAGLLQGGAGWADFTRGEEKQRVWLSEVAATEPRADGVDLTYRPEGLPAVHCSFSLLRDGRSVEFSLTADEGDGWKLAGASMVDNCLPVTDAEEGHVFAPVYNGWDYPANSGLMFSRGTRSFRHQATFQMVGLQKAGSAAVLSWNDCYGEYRTSSLLEPPTPIPGAQALVTSLWTSAPPKAWRLTVAGQGGYSEAARAYREIAREHGFLKTWQEKWAERPGMKLLAGAADMKPFVLSRSVAHTRYNQGDQERVYLGYTFEQAAEMAEHWKGDLGLDRVLFVLAGWIHRGYDNQHPDILPAAPECGGDEKLAECSRRVKALGYLFGLHDNYQDLYPDAPSFDLRYTIKRPDGEPALGGEWAGGQCYLICSKTGLELAHRNLPEVKKLFGPTIYFTDTTFAAGLYECSDPDHPENACDDMRYKSDLARYCQETFGGHGSEHGWEWAVPVTDYFEGNSYASHHSELGAKEGHTIPLLELIYHDCVAVYAHQGSRVGPSSAETVLRYLAVARMPLYQFGGPRYWEKESGGSSLPVRPLAPSVKPLGPREFEVVYRWQVYEAVQPDLRAFVHFTNPEGTILFQDDHELDLSAVTGPPGKIVEEAARTVRVPEEAPALACDLRLGIIPRDGGGRFGLRARDDGTTRYVVGRLFVGRDDRVSFTPQATQEMADPTVFARAENPETAKLCTTDRFIKNTYAFLSATSRLCFDVPMIEHRYLRPDGSVELSRFANGCRIVVNVGTKPFAHEDAVLPPNGFLVTAPTLLAFHASRVGKSDYGEGGALFVATSLDGKPLAESTKVRVYRGFGPTRFGLPTRAAAVSCDEKTVRAADGLATVEVEAEATVTPAD